ncbi:uncharacterized protein Z518_00846 [Rhinocladiella mackenziei CBS 650.93]|uniref:ABM domain-containing protein n=1 Tax=Rhinocladiella mackenziei CBS 650.93 TaxID=1442369 RepID=A0A0D2JJW9_9EURO|nr:uncharacterized protein Z518_00846 [Rhinocladiella mackenziei CBS 650.93]KIX09765.1 hypothetical protein Z518_00846 [Rhinocladiella mackenziei CBS 650.93]
MAIIELAKINLKGGITASDPLLMMNTKEVKRVIEEYSKLQTLFYTQIDDPTVMFVIGAWESKDQHQHGFEGSPQQDEIYGLIKGQMEIEWMHYMDIEQSRIPINAPVLAMIKETLPSDIQKTAFDHEFVTRTQRLGGAHYGAVSAWNLLKDDTEATVRVNFSGWESIKDATEGIVNTVEDVKKFRTRPSELNFFFVERTRLDC